MVHFILDSVKIFQRDYCVIIMDTRPQQKQRHLGNWYIMKHLIHEQKHKEENWRSKKKKSRFYINNLISNVTKGFHLGL